MLITIGGNTWLFASGAAIVSPPAMLARDCRIASWITRFPAVRAVISSPSRMLTPEPISVPSVRVKRDTAALRSTSPSTGIFSSSRSITSLPPAWRSSSARATPPPPRRRTRPTSSR
jgi:hypothetical protein